MRITHVVGTNGFAGIERYVAEVALEQQARGHEVTVVGGQEEAVRGFLAAAPVEWRRGDTAKSCVSSLAGAGRRDVVHSHIGLADTAAAIARPFTRGLHVSTRHITHRRGFSSAGRLLAPWVRKQLDLEIAVSGWTSRQLELPSDTVILNGVRKQDLPTAERSPSVLMAHRLEPEKDTTTGLQAWEASGLRHQGWRLLIAGSGSEEAALRSLAERLDLSDSVTFLGWVTQAERLYREAAVFLAPAPTEPCGLSILQAMAVGAPVVAAASGGNLETIGSVAGARLFPPRRPVEAARQLDALADASVRRQYGQELRDAQVRSFSIEVHVDALMLQYRAIGAPC